jgi:hypothetical protein
MAIISKADKSYSYIAVAIAKAAGGYNCLGREALWHYVVHSLLIGGAMLAMAAALLAVTGFVPAIGLETVGAWVSEEFACLLEWEGEEATIVRGKRCRSHYPVVQAVFLAATVC